MDRDASVLIWVFSVLGRDGYLLLVHWLSGVNVAVLEDDCGIAENEIDGAVNVAVAIELTLGVHVQRVLITDDLATVNNRVVCTYSECNGLMLGRTSVIFKCYVTCHEPCTGGGCISKRVNW